MWTDVYLYKMGTSWNPNSNIAAPDRPQYDRPAACVIAQQYSSATFVSLRFHYRKKKFVRFSKILFQCFTSLKRCVCLKLRTMELRVIARLCISYNFRNNRMQKSSGPIGED